ncbi:DUF3618 domain-containing protein [Leucobacter celer]|jgi:type VI protein secretion system component VasF|uniref:DUF3618 domain-containing protein n=1 Tax=Leucobacter celer TaxID=668625 RepID=UPI0006A7C75D|nr:DUF3618 domain-containing protein [Leucobacter celer]
MTAHEKQQGVADAAVARAELYDTLSQLKDRLNYAQRVDDAVDEAKLRIAEQKRRNPLGFAAGVAGAAAVAGLVVWGVASAVAKRLR